jgi:hypothetical protein
MSETTGYQIRDEHRGKTAICKDCAEEISLNMNLDKPERSNELEELDTRIYASKFCVVCEKDITRGNGGSVDYPIGIFLLLDKHFEGVYPRIDRGGREQINDAVTVPKNQATSHDSVIIQLNRDEKTLAEKLDKFLNKLSQRGKIRGKMDRITDEEGELKGYDFIVFAVQ